MGALFNSYILAQASVSQYFIDSNFAGQVIVVLLILFSLAAWVVMLGKYQDLSDIKRRNLHLERQLSNAPTVLDYAENKRDLRGSYGALIKGVSDAWDKVKNADVGDDVRMGRIENSIARTLAEQNMRYESKMVLLGSIISGAPFLGLLGTVWGVMDSFGALSTQTSATLQALAPGVSGALLTTVAGLVVAIPSVFGYNFLLSMSKSMSLDLENFASLVADRMELEMRHKSTPPIPSKNEALASEKFLDEMSSSVKFNPEAE